ncbi:hypothetical protein AVDCRST_MAG84-1636 [uncultured Microcoleus sp.]|uniref:Uncharacterized protein n=1 Tax=uncultured Microcoleus sp. TaxID=259945 RepID=A0A6J4LAF0_9CYAN|nr:hypothetical protein AVDCRST_MAG84-1636 [uncultured Microcoleus sp.]
MADKTWTTTEPDYQGSNHSSSSNNNNAKGDRISHLSWLPFPSSGCFVRT